MRKPVAQAVENALDALIESRLLNKGPQSSGAGRFYICRCPFCDGGSKKVYNFYVNVTFGFGMCHRATCGWKGGYNDLFKELTGSPFDGSVEVQDTSTDYHKIMSMLKTAAVPEYTYHDGNAFIEGARDLTSCPTEIALWLERRGYDPTWMLDKFPCFLPPQDQQWGRVGFYVRSNDKTAYQLYSYTGKHTLKTINPKNEVLSQHLFNYNTVKDSKETLFIHEGIFDVARSTQRGLNAVAIMGTNLSDTQMYLLSETSADEICFCLDGDLATSKFKRKETASGKFMIKDDYFAMTCASTLHRNFSVMRLPENRDPDDCTEEEYYQAYCKRRIYEPHFRLRKMLSA